MSENDTIPAVLRIDHHAELRRLADLLENEHGPDDEYTGYCADHIRDHADALAKQIASATDAVRREREEARTRRERDAEIIRAYQAKLAEAEARAETATKRAAKLGVAIYAAQAYIDVLNKGIGPSHPHYLAYRDAYRNAMDDLPDPDGGDAT